MSMRDRRRRRLESDDSYDPFLSFNVDKYLEMYYPTMTTSERRRVWKLAQKEDAEDEFDWGPIEDLIDDIVDELYEDKHEWTDGSADEELDDGSDDSTADDSEDVSDDVSAES